MNKQYKPAVIITIIFFLMVGCSTKPPDPVPVKNWDKSTTINHALLKKNISIVPKDPLLKKTRWAYKVKASKSYGYFFKNEQIKQVFLVAHNADRIIIFGRSKLANEYKRYFKKNGVTANIEINKEGASYGKVDILFLNKWYQDPICIKHSKCKDCN